MRDDFQIMADDLANELKNGRFSDKQLILVHFVAGPQKNPYVIRRSAMRVNNSTFDNFIKKGTKEKEKIIRHNIALRNFIQYFARHNTFLKLVVDNYARAIEKYPNLMNMSSQLKVGELTDMVYDHVKLQITDGEGYDKWIVAPEDIDDLIPENFAQAFWEFFYKTKSTEDLSTREASAYMECLEFLRAKTLFSFIKKDGRSISKIDDESKGNIYKIYPELKDEHTIITAFQSMFMFMRGLNWNNKSDMNTTAIVKRLELNENEDTNDSGAEDHMALGIVIVSPGGSENFKDIYKEIQKAFEGYFGILDKHNDEMVGETSRLLVKSGQDKKLVEYYNVLMKDYDDEVTKLFQSYLQQYNAQMYSRWILLLVHKLTDKLHEGKKLEFYFICGDRSEFEDHENTDFQSLGDDDISILRIPKFSRKRKDKIDYNKIANIAVAWLSGEHFPWFEDGKYALLWDVSSNARKPCGIVSIKNTSWKHLIKDRFFETSKILIPSCMIASITGNPRTTCIVKVIEEETDVKLIKKEAKRSITIREIIRLHKDKWVKVHEDSRIINLEKLLLKNLVHHYNLKDDDDTDKLKKIIKWVADDPSRGGILVFINKGKTNPFKMMGKPWGASKSELKITDEDRIALMSHDGATIVTYSDNEFKYSYRHLLSFDSVWPEVKGQLEEIATNCDIEDVIREDLFPLTCVGSRRWSAALTAFMNDVLAVIVISQDGDMHYWKASLKKENGKTLTGKKGLVDYDAEVAILSRTKEAKHYKLTEKDGGSVFKAKKL